MTENGCQKGGQCLYQHPNTVGRCLRCGSTKHVVADCKRPRRDPTANANKGKGRSTSSTSAKSSTSQQAKAKAKYDPKKKAAPKGKGKPKPQPKASAAAASSSSGQAQTAELLWAANATQDVEMSGAEAVLPTQEHLLPGLSQLVLSTPLILQHFTPVSPLMRMAFYHLSWIPEQHTVCFHSLGSPMSNRFHPRRYT